jgi:hypothetical protein
VDHGNGGMRCNITQPEFKIPIPMFTVRKSNGQFLDLRAANSRLEEFLIKLPDMTELLHSLAAEKENFYTSLDLTSSFLQIPLKKDCHRILQAFVVP